MLSLLLKIFDVDGGFESAAIAKLSQRTGCRGLEYGGKATILDAMLILKKIWDGDNKYAKDDSISRCWRKAEILPPSWNAAINNEVGSMSLPTKDKQITKEECIELCQLFRSIQVKVASDKSGNISSFSALDNSFAFDTQMNFEDRRDMANGWAVVEDNPIVINAEIDQELDELGLVGDDDDDDEDDVDDDEIDVTVGDDCNRITIGDVDEHLRQVKLYIAQSGAPKRICDSLLLIGNQLRAHQATKRMNSPTLHRYFQKPSK